MSEEQNGKVAETVDANGAKANELADNISVSAAPSVEDDTRSLNSTNTKHDDDQQSLQEEEHEPQEDERKKPWYKRLWNWASRRSENKKKANQQPADQIPTAPATPHQNDREEPKSAYLGQLNYIKVGDKEVRDKEEVKKYITQVDVQDKNNRGIKLTQINFNSQDIKDKTISLHGQDFEDKITFDTTGKVVDVKFDDKSKYIGQAELMLEVNHNTGSTQFTDEQITAAFNRDEQMRVDNNLHKHGVSFAEFKTKQQNKLTARDRPGLHQEVAADAVPAAASITETQQHTQPTTNVPPITAVSSNNENKGPQKNNEFIAELAQTVTQKRRNSSPIEVLSTTSNNDQMTRRPRSSSLGDKKRSSSRVQQ